MHPLEAELRSLLEHQIDASTSELADGEDCDGDDEIPVGRPVPGYAAVIDPLPPAIAGDLADLVSQMIAAGLGEQCLRIFCTWRSDFLQESISRLGFRQPGGEPEVRRWVVILRVAVLILFPSERRLCDRVFSGDLFADARDLFLAEVCRRPVRRLLAFPDAVAAAARNSPDKLFDLILMYEALIDLIPEIANVFSGERCTYVLLQSAAAAGGTAVATRSVFAELENRIRRDPVAPPVPGGHVHPITKYVVNYLLAASSFRRILEKIMDEDGGAAAGDQFVWAMDLLIHNLEAKARSYRDPAQRCLFLLNNEWYIAKKTKEGDLGSLLGEDWIRGQAASVQRRHGVYQKMAWGKLMDLLDAGSGRESGSSSPAPASLLGEKLHAFNECFREIYKTQAGWAAADERLAAELRHSAIQLILPAYRSFLMRLRSSPEKGTKPPQKIVYSPGDVEARIKRLFRGR